MKFVKKIAFTLAIAAYLSSAFGTHTLKIENRYTIPSPQGLTCHSMSGIKYKDWFIFVYYAAQTSYQHGGVALSKQSLYMSCGKLGQWLEPKEIATAEEICKNDQACFDPVLFEVDGSIYLFYKIGHSPRDWNGFVKITKDGGATWSNASALPQGFFGAGKCKPLITKNGRDLICGACTQRENISIPKKINESCRQDGWVTVDILENFKNFENFSNQVAWKQGEKIGYELKGPGSVVIQPAIWKDQNNDHVLHMLCRSNKGKLVYAQSFDCGLKWVSARESELPSNYSAIDIARTKQGVFMVWNPLEKPAQGDARWKLVLSQLNPKMRPDLLTAWKNEIVLEEDKNKKNEYSFPTIIPCDDSLFVGYISDRKEIRLVKISAK